MVFYLRKAFKTGPIRLNLSKGGLGLSAGITGARVGINTKGTYVHGGRHGLYYRKYMKQGKQPPALGKQPSARGGKAFHGGASSRQSGTVSIFHDTGVTFSSRSAELRNVSRNEPALPSSKLVDTPFKLASGATILLFLFSFFEDMGWLILPTIIFGIATAGWLAWNGYWKNKAEKALQVAASETEKEKKLSAEKIVPSDVMPDRWRTWLNVHLHAVIGELAMRHEEIDTLSTLRFLDEKVPAKKEMVDGIRASILGDLLDEMLEDHLLSEEEEQAIRRLLEQLNLPESLIAMELDRLDHYHRIRKEMERPLELTDPGIPLVRGENAYEVFDRARLLNERVLKRFQRDNIQYRVLGYEVDSEGKLVITDRRLLVVDRNSREYRLNRLVDITADPEAGIVELALSNRKSPVIITVEEPLVLAVRLEKVLEEMDL